MGVGLPATVDPPAAAGDDPPRQSEVTQARPRPREVPHAEQDAPRLTELLRVHYAGVWRTLRRLGVDEGSADDAAQEAFIVLSRNAKWVAHKPRRKVVTTFVFQVRNIPAALYKALGGFANNGINMTKLESYMLGGSFSATQFYADVEGHPHERGLDLALKELDFVCQPKTLKILGVYPAHPFRRKF